MCRRMCARGVCLGSVSCGLLVLCVSCALLAGHILGGGYCVWHIVGGQWVCDVLSLLSLFQPSAASLSHVYLYPRTPAHAYLCVCVCVRAWIHECIERDKETARRLDLQTAPPRISATVNNHHTHHTHPHHTPQPRQCATSNKRVGKQVRKAWRNQATSPPLPVPASKAL